MAKLADDEKEKITLEKLFIPPRVHKGRIALFFTIWKPHLAAKTATPFEAMDGFRLVDMFPTEAEAKVCAECSRLDYLPGCAIIIDTETKMMLRADNFHSGKSLSWVDGISKPA